MEVRICPDCGRPKAGNWEDAKNGLCPKWYAITDKEAENDCKLHKVRQTTLEAVLEANPGIELRLPGTGHTITLEEYISAIAGVDRFVRIR